jgi:hypothetical protein
MWFFIYFYLFVECIPPGPVRYIRIRFYSAFCPISSNNENGKIDDDSKDIPPLIIGKIAIFGVPLINASNSLLKFSPPFFFHYYSKKFKSSLENNNTECNNCCYSSPKTLTEYYNENSNSHILPCSPSSITKYNSSLYPSKNIRGSLLHVIRAFLFPHKFKVYHSNCLFIILF